MNLARRHPWNRNRRAVTLIELLVVVSILLALAAVALPQVQPMMETRKVREAARSINVFFGAARTRAIQTRRPCGVILHRSANNPNAVIDLEMVEIPPHYSGDTINARMTLTWGGVPDGDGYATVTADSTDVPAYTIRLGDQIQFNHQGPWYEVTDAATGGEIENGYVKTFPIEVRTRLLPGASLPWSDADPKMVPFCVARQPYNDDSRAFRVRRSGKSLTLPAGIAIDLGVSGLESYPGHFSESDFTQLAAVSKTRPLVITFSPTGAVQQVNCLTTTTTTDAAGNKDSRTFSPVEPIYLLVGRISQVNMPEELPPPSPIPTDWAPTGDGIPNWLDPDCLWISLMPRTGLVSVAQNAYLAPPGQQSGTFEWDDRTTWASSVTAVRKYAREIQMNQGGR